MALGGIEAELSAPAFIGLLGPNGAGKSTLMKLLTLGLLPTRTSAYDKVTNPIIKEFQPATDVAVERAWIPQGGQLFGPLDQAATKLMVNRANPQATLDEVAQKYKSEVVTDYTLD